ncbi:MAG: helix-turn-helix domain-containing protein [Clostridia bacterium]|nr:helix-turn-helix domain-containing protein [Clostridia bacterium]
MTTPSAPVEPPPDRFVRAANWLWDVLPSAVGPTEWVVYAHLYRLTVGFNRSECVVGYGAMAERTKLSKATVIRHIAKLRELGLLTTGETTQAGTLITLFAPVSVVTMSIPKSSIPATRIPTMSIPAEDTPGVVAMSILATTTPKTGQHKPGVATTSIPTMSTNKDKGTMKDNYKQVVAVLSEAGYGVTVDTLESLASDGADVSLSRVRKCIAYIKSKHNIRDKNGTLIAALTKGWEVGEAAEKAAASTEAAQQQQEVAAREEQDKVMWLAQEKERLGAEGLERLRQEVTARAEQEGDYVLKRAKSQQARKDHINGLVDAALLARRDTRA